MTWTVYGTFLPGDRRGWRHRQDGIKPAQPLLEQWHRDRLNYDVVLLNADMQAIAETAITEICTFRTWRLWAVSVRSNHAHVLLTAPNYRPTLVRDQLKAKATTALRAAFEIWQNRPVWAANGDIEFLDNDQDIEQSAIYVSEAQDRKCRDQVHRDA
ncbi:MAG: transposase [Nitrosomonas sp.]